MKIIMAGRGNLGVFCLDSILEKSTDILVIPVRTKDPTQLDIKSECEKRRVEVYEGNINELVGKADLAFSIGYDRKFKKDLIQSCPCINLHLSPLPKYGGLNPFYWAIKNGEESHGVTLHKIAEEIDTGEIIAQRIFPISVEDTSRTLFEKAQEEAKKLFAENLDNLLTGAYKTRPQDLAERSYFLKVNFDEPIDFTLPVKQAYNEVRARIFPPYLGPKIKIEGIDYFIQEVRMGEGIKRFQYDHLITLKDGAIAVKLFK